MAFEAFFKYILSKKYCNGCKAFTPHNIVKKGNILIEECLFCGEKTYIELPNIKKLRIN